VPGRNGLAGTARFTPAPGRSFPRLTVGRDGVSR